MKPIMQRSGSTGAPTMISLILPDVGRSLSPQFQAAWEAASHAVASAVVDRLQDTKE